MSESLQLWAQKRLLEQRVERLEGALELARKQLAELAIKGGYNVNN